MSLNRRTFLAAAGTSLLAPRSARAASSRIEILADEHIGEINPDIYGHFTEHLGGCIYDGIWVGENSKIPNYNGLRKELVDNLKRLKPPVIRWPGGCFADSYNWRDGVGPRAERPKRTNFWANNQFFKNFPNSPQKYDTNQFGTNDFARLCQLTGAEPYFAANLRSATARDFYEWIEYCNSPAKSTTLADLRAAGGSPEPLRVRYWGVGNESWGCGGNFTGDEYAVEFRRFVEWVPRFDTPLSFVASGPNGGDYAWTRSFFSKLTEKSKGPLRNVYGTALHYYCGTTGNGKADEFSTADWYTLLARSNRIEDLIRNHWQILGETDTDHRVKLIVDEWGAWHQVEELGPGYLWAYFPTLRDALVSGISLDTFNRHADKVAMANAAQMINNIHTSFLAMGDKFTVTPVFHVFAMYAAHKGGMSVRTEFSAPRLAAETGKGLSGLSGSCSVHGNRVVLSVVNADHANEQETEIDFRGTGRLSPVKATVLKAKALNARNDFEHPRALEPMEEKLNGGGSPFVYKFAPASVTCLEFTLA